MLNSQCFVNTGLSKTLLKFIHVFLFTLLNVVIRKFKGTHVPCIIFLLGSVALGHLLPLGFYGLSTHNSPPSPFSGTVHYLYTGELVLWGSQWLILASGPVPGNKENGCWSPAKLAGRCQSVHQGVVPTR